MKNFHLRKHLLVSFFLVSIFFSFLSQAQATNLPYQVLKNQKGQSIVLMKVDYEKTSKINKKDFFF